MINVKPQNEAIECFHGSHVEGVTHKIYFHKMFFSQRKIILLLHSSNMAAMNILHSNFGWCYLDNIETDNTLYRMAWWEISENSLW